MPTRNVETVKCNRCNKRVLMQVEDKYEAVVYYEHDNGQPDIFRYYLQFLTCSACQSTNITLFEEDADNPIVIFPPKPESKKEVIGLPTTVEKAYKAAQAVRDIDGNAFAVLLRRLLETICIDRQAKGKTLYEQLKFLAGNGEIPAKLANMADLLRTLGNIGAHASIGEITPAEIPYLDALCNAVLEYVYSAPSLIAEVEQRLVALKKGP